MKAVILSAGQDTNGGNARFVRAARRYGRSSPIIRAVALGTMDPAGVVGRFAEAARKHDVGLELRSAHKFPNPYTYFESDIVWDERTEAEIRGLVRNADVIHLNNSDRPLMKFRVAGKDKPVLLHHHGTLFRNDPEAMLSRAATRKAVQAVSTVDLQRFAPDILHWLPSAYNLDELAAIGAEGAAWREAHDHGVVRIAHAPTNRAGKDTALFLQAVSELQAEGLPLEFDLIENVTNAECLVRKSRAHVVYDQLAWGYGCNSIEAWGMGVPVISGADGWTKDRMRSLWGDLPFVTATAETLYGMLQQMVGSADARAEWAAKGLAHVQKYHGEVPALERLVELYSEAIKRRVRRKTAGPATTFAYSGVDKVRVLGETIPFPDGKATVTDVDVVNRLRYLARRGKYTGLVEV